MSAIAQAPSIISLKRISPTTHSYIFEGSLPTRIIKIALIIFTVGAVLIIPLAYDAAVLLKNRIISSKSDKKASDNKANEAAKPDASRITKVKDFVLNGVKTTYSSIVWGKSWTYDMLPKKVRWILVTSVALQVIRKTVGINQFAEQVSPFTKAFFTAVIQPFFYATGQAGKEGFQAATEQAPKAAQEFAQFVKENSPSKKEVFEFVKDATPVVLDYASVTMSFMAQQCYEGWMQLPNYSQISDFVNKNIVPVANKASNITQETVIPLVGQKFGELANFTINEVWPAVMRAANNSYSAAADHFNENSDDYKNATKNAFKKGVETTASLTKSGLKGFFKTLPHASRAVSDATEYSLDTILKTTKNLGREAYESKYEIANSLSQTTVNLSPLAQRISKVYLVVNEVRRFLPAIGEIKPFILDSFKSFFEHAPTFAAIYSIGRSSFDEYQNGNLGYSVFSGAFVIYVFYRNASSWLDSFSKVRFFKPGNEFYSKVELERRAVLKADLKGGDKTAEIKIKKFDEIAVKRSKSLNNMKERKKLINDYEQRIFYEIALNHSYNTEDLTLLEDAVRDYEIYCKFGEIDEDKKNNLKIKCEVNKNTFSLQYFIETKRMDSDNKEVFDRKPFVPFSWNPYDLS